MGEILQLNNVQLNHVHVFVARKAPQSDSPRFSTAMVFDPNDPELAKLRALIAKSVAENGASLQPEIKAPKHDLSKMQVNAACPADQKPGVVDATNTPIFDHSAIYPGITANVMLDVYYLKSRNRVCIGLLAIQKVADGERLDNRPDVNNLFAPIPVVGGFDPLA